MTLRPPRDVRADAKRVLATALSHLSPGDPEYIALGLLAALDGARLGLTDLTPPEDPNADWRPPTNTTPAAAEQPSPGLAAYRAARGKTTDTTQEGHSQ